MQWSMPDIKNQQQQQKKQKQKQNKKKKEKERKKERSVLFPLLGLQYNALFYFLFCNLWSNVVPTISKLQTSKGRYLNLIKI